MAINTFLGGDGSPSDRLVINGGAATGSTIGARHQCRRTGRANDRQRHSGGERDQRGDDGAWRLHACSTGELRAGAFDYRPVPRRRLAAAPTTGSCARLHRAADQPPDSAGAPPRADPTRPAAAPAAARRLPDHRAGTRDLWGGAASGPAIGAPILGTLDDRVGDTYEPDLRRCACARASSVDLPTRKSRCRPRRPAPAPCPLFCALGLGPLLRPNDRQPLSRLRRSARQRQSGRLPGRHRSSARIADRRPLRARRPLWRLWRRATPT